MALEKEKIEKYLEEIAKFSTFLAQPQNITLAYGIINNPDFQRLWRYTKDVFHDDYHIIHYAFFLALIHPAYNKTAVFKSKLLADTISKAPYFFKAVDKELGDNFYNVRPQGKYYQRLEYLITVAAQDDGIYNIYRQKTLETEHEKLLLTLIVSLKERKLLGVFSFLDIYSMCFRKKHHFHIQACEFFSDFICELLNKFHIKSVNTFIYYYTNEKLSSILKSFSCYTDKSVIPRFKSLKEKLEQKETGKDPLYDSQKQDMNSQASTSSLKNLFNRKS